MLSRRRLAIALPILLALIAAAYTVWLVRQVEADLTSAQRRADQLKASIDEHDASRRDEAVQGLQDAAASANAHTGGVWWAAMAHLPMIGDDAAGIRALSRSLDTVANEGITPLADSIDRLDHVSRAGAIDLRVVHDLAAPVAHASAAFAQAQNDVRGLDSSGYAGVLKGKFDTYVDLVSDASAALGSAQTATEILPDMVGASGPRDYLLIFQNNAEIRATGGMPGSWALVHAEGGRLTLAKQGTAAQFGERKTPILPLSKAELALYDRQLGTYYQDAGFTPDFPRAAQLMAARWQESYPGASLDGVLSLDPVALSYLLDGTGPVRVGDLTLTRDNVVSELLNTPYVERGPEGQDALFQQAAKAIFDATTGDLASPIGFVTGLNRAAREGRFLVAPFDDREREALAGTRVEGALTGDDGHIPHVDIGVNDATGSKMSYYLRYWSSVQATSCRGGTQTLTGSMTLNQAISPENAKALPVSVTGGGGFGTDAGSQLVLVRLYAPFGGTIDKVVVDGKSLDDQIDIVDLAGRPATTLAILLSNRDDVVVNWSMTAGPDQTRDIEVGMTPSVVPGSNDRRARSAC